ncbi:MAG: ATP-dependent RecD-like DNA helicase, partial [Deltaproteobacteria bacterium CG03_land_8_20_14_0_80_45_14]
VVRLTEIFRQAQESMIVVNAHKVNQGQLPVLKEIDKSESTDFQFIEEEDPEKILQNILDLCSEGIPGQFRFHPLREIQVLAPMQVSDI